jgi:hypothetical protein
MSHHLDTPLGSSHTGCRSANRTRPGGSPFACTSLPAAGLRPAVAENLRSSSFPYVTAA